MNRNTPNPYWKVAGVLENKGVLKSYTVCECSLRENEGKIQQKGHF